MTESYELGSDTRLKIVMHRDFHRFGASQRREFLKELGWIVGYMPDGFVDVIFRPGCVIFEGTVPTVVAERLRELFERWRHLCRVESNTQLGDISSDEEMQIFDSWMRVFNIKSISDENNEEYSVQIIKKRRRSIIFVHGVTGSSQSFANMPKFLSDRLACPTNIYEYPANLFSRAPSLRFVARGLENWIRNTCDAEIMGIIAHSMGGLVVRKMICLQLALGRERRLDTRVRQITFIASPYSGSSLALIAQMFSYQLEELKMGAPFVEDLNHQWLGWLQHHGGHCKIRSIFGTADKIVGAENAQGLDAEAVPILGAGHIDIIKPKRADDEIVCTIERFLREAGF